MSTFAITPNPTPFGLFDADADFQADADAMVVFVKRLLGDDVLQVELTKRQIWACFERAAMEWGSLVNQYQAKSSLTAYLGMSTSSVDVTNIYPRNTLEFVMRQADPFAAHANLSARYTDELGYIELEEGRQDYDIHAELRDASGSLVFDKQVQGGRRPLRIMEVFHTSPTTAYRFFDSTSAINYLNNEFSFESFTPETIFYVLPVFEDVIRAAQMKTSFKVRRSHYRYTITGNNKLRIYPVPTRVPAGRLYIRVAYAQDPVGPDGFYSGSVDPNDDSLHGVSSISNVPFSVVPYSTINEVGRQFIRELTLAYARELLGIVRSKIRSIPIPGAEVTLDGDTLRQEGREQAEKIRERIIALFEETTYDKLLEKDAAKVESLEKILSHVAVPGGGIIRA